ncbi:hypothetical protein HSX01_30960 [Pseudomonas aeruginosa]|uniref:hypothetical protein n=1 Tax=Pseudomonas aeruginosa TaxID=287 RepID=UPI00156B6E47|nr:hypothetical protein [Pseudomonas aeruginosa]NRR47928.1 hypothetical protein [Pseudomonas aeruginosa]
MTKYDHLSECASGRKEETTPLLVVKVRNGRNKSSETTADFSFLSSWLGASAVPVVEALAKFIRQYSSATPVYGVRLVLEF